MIPYPETDHMGVVEKALAVTAWHHAQSKGALRTETTIAQRMPSGERRVLVAFETETEPVNTGGDCNHVREQVVGTSATQVHFVCPDCKHAWSEDR